MQLTTVGLGARAIGGAWEVGWGPQDDGRAVREIDEVLALRNRRLKQEV